ncbi:MAG: TAXI family TRAP transporter solute-binding subunit [Alphaproteobacteria bacterium]
MVFSRIIGAWLIAICLFAGISPSFAQGVLGVTATNDRVGRAPSADAAGEADEVQRTNQWTVGLVGGLLEGAYLRFAAEISRAVDDGENMRVLGIMTKGSIQNVHDLLYLKGVDVGLVSADTFDDIIKAGKIRSITDRLQYITQLHVNTLQLLVRSDIKTIKDLAGKKVAVAKKGSSSAALGIKVLKKEGVKADVHMIGWTNGFQKVKTGEFAGVFTAFVKGQTTIFSSIDPKSGMHLLPISFDKYADEYYVPIFLDHKDYPNLIAEGESIETLGSPVVLAVYNWPRGTDRFRKVARFIEYFFKRFDTLRKPPYHPAWKEINLAAKVPGWKRYWYAEEVLKKYLKKRAAGGIKLNAEERKILSSIKNTEQKRQFREFLKWKKEHKPH